MGWVELRAGLGESDQSQVLGEGRSYSLANEHSVAQGKMKKHISLTHILRHYISIHRK